MDLEQSKRKWDIYRGEYEGWYSVREEKFITDHEAKRNSFLDPDSGKPLSKRQERSYFFRLSKYKEKLLKHFKENPKFIVPEVRK